MKESETLDWNKSDVERRFGFESTKHTGVNSAFSFALACVLTLAVYGFLYLLWRVSAAFQNPPDRFIEMFFIQNPVSGLYIVVATVFLACWTLAILWVKLQKIKLQRMALEIRLVSDSPDFVLAPNSARHIIETMYDKVSEPRRFLLLNRVERSLSNLKNIGRISDVAEGLEVQAENDENHMESSYTLMKSFIWGIPVLGFIGTVLGLAKAVGSFGSVLSTQGGGTFNTTQLLAGLQTMTSGLGTAFETTLIALVAAFLLQLLATMMKKKEEDFLDECSDYCHRHIISRLRIVDVDDTFAKD